ncbi:DNA polymerase [Caudoviricetes sp.]|nr:DNA polymerase [Caudoviricetes sp.]
MRRKIDFTKCDGLQGALFGPETDWQPAKNFPNLSGEKLLGFDIETYDPHLRERGPGFIRKDAKVVGFSVATHDAAWYFPFDHLGGGNLSKDACVSYARELLESENRFIVGANLQYELEGVSSLGIKAKAKTIDIQIAEALIDEEAPTYQLEALCHKYLGKGKDETLLREAAAAYGVDPKSGLWKLHSKYVGSYAEFDALSALHIFKKQLPILQSEGTESIFQLECELLPILWEMRQQGIPIDLEAADKLSDLLKTEEDNLRLRLRNEFNADVNEYSGAEIAMVCDRLRILFPRTKLGAPSFTADYLDEADHPFLILINDLRECSGMRNKFVDGWIHKNQVNGRIHPQWKQCASDEGGTRTGRMAASNPNPQQIPAGKYRKTGKENPIGRAIRACFISHTGKYGKFDYNQQEPRILVHFANVCNFTGAKLAAMNYQNDREADFYKFMMECAYGVGCSKEFRRPAKDLYLGRCYGMGIKKMARKLNKTDEEAKQILQNFDQKVPFVKEIADACMKAADERGYIKTLLGRRRHFNLWEPVDTWKMREQGLDVAPRSKSAAEIAWPGKALRRSNTHKALNALIQGSAADMTKSALIAIRRNANVIPYMQVHDEIDFPAYDEAHAKQVQEIAENCVKMTVPIRADLTIKKTWS